MHDRRLGLARLLQEQGVYSLCASIITRTPSAIVAGVGAAPAICSMVIAMFDPSRAKQL
jgi:hypothetical protein